MTESAAPQPLVISAEPLELEEVVAVARKGRPVSLDQELLRRLAVTRSEIAARWLGAEAPLIYSLNTGVGAFKDRRVAPEDMESYQVKMILAHASGLGGPFPEDVVRAMLLLRLNAFSADLSGISPALAQRIVDFLNFGLTPMVPAKGSVGASGDLAPLAHLAGALLGFPEAEIFFEGARRPASQAIAAAGLDPAPTMAAKEASALLNGSTASLAVAVLALADAEMLARHADLGLALSLEAMRCEKDAFDPLLQAARPHPGQTLVARNVLRLVSDSQRMTHDARALVFPDETRAPGSPAPARVQDSYALRCAPQVHGPVREALAYVRRILETEVNSATDNPLILHDEGGRRPISGGHFHGQYLAQAMDFLAIALADLSAIAERRVARLIDPVLSFGLPRNLASGKQGLNTGYATVQCSLSALVMENRSLATPGSVDSIPGKGNAEDHVSNSTWCARKAAMVAANAKYVIAGEILAAAQALSLVAELAADYPIGRGSTAALAALRETIPARLEGDVWFATDMDAALSLLESGDLLKACAAAGCLLE